MRIRIKLGGDLKRYGDAGLQELELGEPATVAEAMKRIGIDEEAGEVLVIVNDEIVPPSEHERFALTDDDRLAVMPQLKGG